MNKHANRINYLGPAKCLRKTTKCRAMHCTSIALRQVMPNGAGLGEGFPAAVSAGGERECRVYLSPAARAASHHTLTDGGK